MNEQHASGPWEVSATGAEGIYCIYSQTGFIASASTSADARLIAAAPNLLGILEAIVSNYDGPNSVELGRRAIDIARAAIATATGTSA